MDHWVSSLQTAIENGVGERRKVPENQLLVAVSGKDSRTTVEFSGIYK